MLQTGHSGDGCVLASTLCKYDLRKGDLFVLIWARVRRVRRGSLSSELLMCVQYFIIASCGYMTRGNRCMYMAHFCFYVCAGFSGNVCCVAPIVKNSVFSLGVMNVCVADLMDVVFSICMF